MSGGSFNYAYRVAHRFATDLGFKLDETKDYFDDVNIYNKLREIEHVTRIAARLMEEVELFYSGDTGDESFMKNLELISCDFQHLEDQDD